MKTWETKIRKIVTHSLTQASSVLVFRTTKGSCCATLFGAANRKPIRPKTFSDSLAGSSSVHI